MGAFDSAELAYNKLREELAKLEKRNLQLTEKVINMQDQITDLRVIISSLEKDIKILEDMHEGI